MTPTNDATNLRGLIETDRYVARKDYKEINKRVRTPVSNNRNLKSNVEFNDYSK